MTMTLTEAVPVAARSGRVVDRILIGLFLLMMTLPALDSVLSIDPSPLTVEKALPPPFPKLERPINPGALNRFWKGSKLYFSGNFGFRRSLLRLCNVAELRWFGRFSTSTVIPGQQGRLLYNPDGKLVEPGRFRPDQLEKWRTVVEARQEQCRRRGIVYLFVLAPDPISIYPEAIPAFLPNPGKPSMGAQLIDELERHSQVKPLDLHDPVRAGRSLGRLFHRTDTHWNDLGAYCGYRAIMGRLGEIGPGLEPAPLESFEIREVTGLGGDIAGMVALRYEFPEVFINLIPRQPRRSRTPDGKPLTPEFIAPTIRASISTEIPGSTLPRAVIIRDSFCDAMAPFPLRALLASGLRLSDGR